MMKFIVFAALIAVTMGADPKTNAECEATVGKEVGVPAKDVCAVCRGSKASSTACAAAKKDTSDLAKITTSIQCTAMTECYQTIAEAKAAAATKAAEEKYGKYCPTDKAKCADKDSYCPTWAKQKPSECTANPDWMLQNCQASCCPICTGKNTLKLDECPGKDRADLCVKNTHSSCHSWATATPKSECDANAKWMRPNCMQSCCDVCKKDADKCPTVKQTCQNDYAVPTAKEGSDKCEKWAKSGECTKNPKWMKSNCAKECCSICQPVAPKRATVARQQVIRQPYQTTFQPRQVVAQPRQVISQPQPRQVVAQPQPSQVISQPQPSQVISQPRQVVGQPYFG